MDLKKGNKALKYLFFTVFLILADHNAITLMKISYCLMSCVADNIRFIPGKRIGCLTALSSEQ